MRQGGFESITVSGAGSAPAFSISASSLALSAVMLVPPSWEVLHDRLTDRGTEFCGSPERH